MQKNNLVNVDRSFSLNSNSFYDVELSDIDNDTYDNCFSY